MGEASGILCVTALGANLSCKGCLLTCKSYYVILAPLLPILPMFRC